MSIEANCLFQVDQLDVQTVEKKKKKNYAAFKGRANLIPALNIFDLIHPLNPGFLNGHMQSDEQKNVFCLIKIQPKLCFSSHLARLRTQD